MALVAALVGIHFMVTASMAGSLPGGLISFFIGCGLLYWGASRD